MGFIAHYRGRLVEYGGPFPEQARADWEGERAAIEAALAPGDALWLWRRVDASDRTDGSASEWGGLALRRAGLVIRVWLVWEEH